MHNGGWVEDVWTSEREEEWWRGVHDTPKPKANSYGVKQYAVRLVDLEDKEVSVHWPTESQWAFDKLAGMFKVCKAQNKKQVDTIEIPVERAAYLKRQRVAPLACAYHSAKACAKNLFGVEFTREDEEWFLGHGLLKPGGLPMPDTLRVVQGLIAPYDLRIARVRIQPGLSIKGNLREWRAILGMNPMAIADRSTTNEEYAEQTGMPLGEVNNLFRMEYNPVPYAGGVVCESSATSEFGHASYAAPRRRPTGNEWLSYKFSRVAGDPWLDKIPEWDYVEADVEEVLDVYGIIREEEKRNAPPVQRTFELEEPKEPKLLAFQNAGKCVMCGEWDVPKEDPICGLCWYVIWDGYKCPDKKCAVDFGKASPEYVGGDAEKGELLGKCPTCKQELHLRAKEDEGAHLALRALAGRFNKADRDDWNRFSTMAYAD